MLTREQIATVIDAVLLEIDESNGPLAGKLDWMDEDSFNYFQNSLIDNVVKRLQAEELT